MANLPQHFQAYASQLTNEGQKTEFDFCDDLTDLFYVYYFGRIETIDEQKYILDADVPIRFVIQPIYTQKSILLFDQSIHGYNGLMLHQNTNEESYPELIKLSAEPFHIHIQLRYKTAFEKQKHHFPIQQHQITLINGDKMDWDEFKMNAFDAIHIEFYNEHGTYLFQDPMH